jgi:hypothetical protein
VAALPLLLFMRWQRTPTVLSATDAH